MQTARRPVGTIALGASIALLAAAASPAGAATTIGELPAAANQVNNCPPQTTLVQSAPAGGTAWAAPSAGVITSWRTFASDQPTSGVKFKVFRPTADPDEFSVVGTTAVQPAQPGTVNGPFPVRIPVQAGDRISVLAGDNGGGCYFNTGSSGDEARQAITNRDAPVGGVSGFSTAPNTAVRVDVSARLEPDADGDGWGDETQDRCPGLAGTANGCVAGGPRTFLTTSPRHRIETKRKRITVRFRFASPEPGTFECSLDGADFSPCASPLELRLPVPEKRERHIFRVAAIDPNGVSDPTPARFRFSLEHRHRHRHR